MNLDRLVRCSRELLGLELSAETQRSFRHYADELLAWNEKFNLTAITAPEEIEMRHFLDSLSVIRAVTFKPGMRVIDVGAGAGFPGLPLKLAFPGIELTLLEATAKKTAFLEHIVERLKLSNVKVLNARAEDAGRIRPIASGMTWRWRGPSRRCPPWRSTCCRCAKSAGSASR